MARKKIVNFLIAQDFLKRTAGDYAVDLVKICERSPNGCTDEAIGAKMKKLKITEIRTILNRLHYRGIACYQKTRNQKTGWYTYTWEIKPARVAELILEEQAEEIKKLERKMGFEVEYDFFSCGGRCEGVPFEIAAEYNFKCPECGKPTNLVNNKKRMRKLRRRVKIMKFEVNALEQIAKKHKF